MALSEEDINDALNTPTDQLGEGTNEPMDDEDEVQSYDETGEEHEEGEELVDDDDTTGDDLVDTLLGNSKPAKPENRVQRLANAAREEKEARERLERENRELRERMDRDNTDAMRRAQDERQRQLDEMDPIERRLLLQEEETRRARFEAADSRDEQRFRAVVEKNPQLKGLADDVEKELAQARRHGQNPDRLSVAKFILGTRAMEALQNGPKAKKAGERRVQQARGRPVGGASNVGSGESQHPRTGASDFEKKFGNMKI